MRGGKFGQHFFTASRQRELNLTPVILSRLTFQKAIRHQPVYQPNRAVMPYLQALGQFANRDAIAFRKTFDGEQRLMLLRSDSRCMRGVLAEPQKLPERVAQVGEGFIF